MELMVLQLPDGYAERLCFIATVTGIPVDYLVRDALEHSYIMSEKQLEMSKKTLPF